MKVKELRNFLNSIPDTIKLNEYTEEEDLEIDFWNTNNAKLEVLDFSFDGVNCVIKLKKTKQGGSI